MPFLIVLVGILLLLLLIHFKLNAVIALMIAAIVTGLLLGMPVPKLLLSINNGIGSTLGGLIMVLSLGAMLGKLVEESGAAQRIVNVLIASFKERGIQWALLITGILIGIPLFYNAGFVILIPLVYSIAATTRLPLLYVGIPMAASLSITHGFLPPHPGPIALASIFKADVGKTLLYGLLLSVPTAVVAGILLPRLLIKKRKTEGGTTVAADTEKVLPPAGKSFLIALAPVLFIAISTIGVAVSGNSSLKTIFLFLQDPTIALLLSVLLALALLRLPVAAAMESCVKGVQSVALLVLIIAAGGAFKQILVDSGIGLLISEKAARFQLSPLFLGWAITALLRIALGSATVAALTASGIVLPLLQQGVPPELMVISVGAGSLMCSHVNDTGFWMFKEYFGLTVKQTFATWTVMESVISVLGLLGVLLLDALMH
jgi:gluconate transporter